MRQKIIECLSYLTDANRVMGGIEFEQRRAGVSNDLMSHVSDARIALSACLDSMFYVARLIDNLPQPPAKPIVTWEEFEAVMRRLYQGW